MSICAVRSRNPAPRAAAVDVTAQLGSGPWRLVVYFASPSYDQADLAQALQALLPGTRTIGCSTSGEIATGEVMQGSLVVLALGDDDLEVVEVQVAEDMRDPASVHAAVDRLEARLGDLWALDRTAHVGIVLMDGLSGAEESVMQILGERSDIPFVGGSAGDDLAFRRTWVHADGASRSGTAVLAVLRPTRGFEVLETQSSVRQGRRLTAADTAATDLLDDTRTTLEAAVATEPASGLLSFDCVLRTLELERHGLADAYGSVFSEIPTAGFATYGEAYRGRASRTATMLLFR